MQTPSKHPNDGLGRARVKAMADLQQELRDALGLGDQAEGMPSPSVETITTRLGARGLVVFAFWPVDADKTARDYSAAWGLIDGKTGSATTLAHEFARSADEALTDQNLSEVGRRAAVAGVTRRMAERVAALAALFPGVRAAAMGKDADLAGVDPYTAGKPWVWANDAETGRLVRSMDQHTRLHFFLALTRGEHPEAAESLLRLPPHLSGLPGKHLAAVRAAVLEAKNPGFGRWSRIRHMAVTAAASAIDRVATLIEKGGALPPAELRQLLGGSMNEVRAFLAADAQPATPDPMAIAAAQDAAAQDAAARPAA